VIRIALEQLLDARELCIRQTQDTMKRLLDDRREKDPV